MTLGERSAPFAAVPVRTGRFLPNHEVSPSLANSSEELLSRSFDEALTEPGFSWNGRVKFVFSRSAVAAELERPEDPGRYLTLLFGPQGVVPMGIVLFPGVNHVKLGEAVSIEKAVLYCAGLPPVWLRGPGACLRLAARHATTGEALLQHLLALGEMATCSGFATGRFWPSPEAESCLINRLAKSLVEIVGHLSYASEVTGPRSRCLTLEAAVSRLGGLGPGLTPSGDDMLTGVLAEAIVLAGAGLLKEESLHGLRAAIALLGETTPIALGMRKHALRGVFLAPLREFVEALGDKRVSPAKVREIARELTTHGEQSGQDMLTGVTALAWTVARREGAP